MGSLDYERLFSSIERNSEEIIYGTISLPGIDKSSIESFKLKIDFNYLIPRALSIDGKIPNDIDRHVVPDSGIFCVAPSIKIISFMERNRDSKAAYIKELLIPYLYNQIHFSWYGEWANGEYSHYTPGIKEYYCELLRTENLEKVIRVLTGILNGTYKYERNYKCLCGSDKKYKNCHFKRRFTSNELRCIAEDIKILERLTIK